MNMWILIVSQTRWVSRAQSNETEKSTAGDVLPSVSSRFKLPIMLLSEPETLILMKRWKNHKDYDVQSRLHITNKHHQLFQKAVTAQLYLKHQARHLVYVAICWQESSEQKTKQMYVCKKKNDDVISQLTNIETARVVGSSEGAASKHFWQSLIYSVSVRRRPSSSERASSRLWTPMWLQNLMPQRRHHRRFPWTWCPPNFVHQNVHVD